MKIKYITFGKSSKMDPEGITDESGQSEYVDAILRSDGSIYIPEYDIIKIGVPEGTSPGNWITKSKLTRNAFNAVKKLINSLSTNPSPVLSKIALFAKAYLTDTDKVSCVQSFYKIANNSNRTDIERSLALVCLALLIEEETV